MAVSTGTIVGSPSRAWLALATLLVISLLGCRTPAAPHPPPLRTHEGLNATLWLQTAAEWRASAFQAYRSATVHLDRALADPTWTAAIEQQGDFARFPPAVILDMDEAIIRSDRFQASLVADGRPFRLEDWNAWVRREASVAVPGALEYVHHAHGRGVHIYYVTNRGAEVEAESLEVLRKLGFPVDSGSSDLLTMGEEPGWTSDKSSRRAALCKTHRILQIVGDNLNDFVGGAYTSVAERRVLVDGHAEWWGTRWIVMPNPTYGGWEGALYDYDRTLPRREILRRKYEKLETWK